MHTLTLSLDESRWSALEAMAREQGAESLTELASRIADRNFRLFAKRGLLHVLAKDLHLEGDNPFALQLSIHSTVSKMNIFKHTPPGWHGWIYGFALLFLLIGGYIAEGTILGGFGIVIRPVTDWLGLQWW